MKARAKAILFQYGNLHYPQQDIDQRDLREAAVGEERKVLCAMIHSGQAMELVKNKVFVRQLSVRSVVCLDLKHMSEITRRNWIKSY